MVGQRNEGIFTILENVVAGIGEKLSAVGNHIFGSSAAGAGQEAGSIFGGVGEFVGGLFGGNKGAEVSAPAQAPQMAIQAPTKSITQFDVPMDHLGGFSAPQVGTGSVRSNGMNMGSFG